MLSFKDIEILPFEGQHASKTAEPVKVVVPAAASNNEAKIIVKVDKLPETVGVDTAVLERPVVRPTQVVERKKFSQPNGKLSLSTPGIKETLDPPKNKLAENADALLPDMAENFTFEELKAAWNEYALNLKRDKKDSLYATLTDSELTVSSDYKILLEISNNAQAIQLEREKSGLLEHLRSRLRNYQVAFTYKVSEKLQSPIKDNKATFETLAAENPSLHKLRKLFNLDIDY